MIRPSQVYTVTKEDMKRQCALLGVRFVAFRVPLAGDMVLSQPCGSFIYTTRSDWNLTHNPERPLSWRIVVEPI